MDYEIWASDSGNRLLATPDLDEALTWALAYWLREGDEALSALSIGDEQDSWVISGEQLRNLLAQRMWGAQAPWSTSATDRLQNAPLLATAS